VESKTHYHRSTKRCMELGAFIKESKAKSIVNTISIISP
jgi:hypothetical protein